uniref:Cytochrome P450 n=1 Tax=Triparma pacifica TaxID=91992 RepID=A0A7S2VVL8_9STRA|mmetsp:Transcript_1693/g.3206  ORF Transcript_1693/g.3206 Transcript_1693/m.3206 type:complete len:510 (+) Transcript_1693:29-1558(+)
MPEMNLDFDLRDPRLYLAATLFLVLLIWRRMKPYRRPKDVPGPPTKPFVGCLTLIDSNWSHLPDFLLKYNELFGKTWCAPVPDIGLLGGAFFSVVDEASVKHVLKDKFDNYEKGPNFRDALGEFLGEGIFTSDGPLWKVHRKVASHMFSRNLMRNGTLVAIKQVKCLIERLDMVAASESNNTIDMQDMFFRLTIDVFANIAFGVELNSILGKKPHPFALAFDEVQNLSQKRFKDPFWRIKRNFQMTEGERGIKKGCKTMQDFADTVIKNKRRDADSGEKMGPDLLSRFLDPKTGDRREVPSVKELRDIVMNFMIAGRDTTACALSWTFYELVKNPEVAEKVLAEIKENCGALGEKADYESVGKLNYTHAVGTEVLRLHPSVPVDIKFAKNADTMPDGTYIPRGATVCYSPYAIGRSEKVWGADAKKFRPERFIVEGGGYKDPSQYKFPTFNAGYRLCLGKDLAMLEIKLVLAMVLPRYKFEIVNGHKGGYTSTLVLPMEPGLVMRVTKQ